MNLNLPALLALIGEQYAQIVIEQTQRAALQAEIEGLREQLQAAGATSSDPADSATSARP